MLATPEKQTDIFLKDPLVTNWIKIASQHVSPAWQCSPLAAGGSRGRKAHPKTLMDLTMELMLELLLERLIYQHGKSFSVAYEKCQTSSALR